MNRQLIGLSLITVLSISAFATDTVNKSDDERFKKLEKKVKSLNKKLNKVRAHDAFDNIKFSVDFRNTYDHLEYKNKDTGEKAKNNGLYTSRLILNMKSAPTDKLAFYGQLATYSNWGAHLQTKDPTLQGWAGSSKSSDTIFRVREAYFVYSDKMAGGKLPYSFSLGRRPATNGFLANHRENLKKPGSPLAHITNMEVDAGMVKLNTEQYLLPGSFIKFVYGRSYQGGLDTAYTMNKYSPYAQKDGDINDNVDFFVTLGSLYNDGQYNLMFEDALILGAKGARTGKITPTNMALNAGKANLTALSLQVDGVGDEINDFLDDTTLFASIASTQYMPDDGHQLLGSTSNTRGYSVWLGATFPDMITDEGRFGLEYNHGTKNWTPMTWAEDSATGSKLSVRGDAYEAYWNFNLFGQKNLPSQIRYSHLQHDYTPNGSGWVTPQTADITADDIRVAVSYKY